jgi:CheY-like chemotaxis protein
VVRETDRGGREKGRSPARRALVVESSLGACAVVQVALDLEGWAVTVVADGESARDAMRSPGPFHLVVCDAAGRDALREAARLAPGARRVCYAARDAVPADDLRELGAELLHAPVTARTLRQFLARPRRGPMR